MTKHDLRGPRIEMSGASRPVWDERRRWLLLEGWSFLADLLEIVARGLDNKRYLYMYLCGGKVARRMATKIDAGW